MKSLIADLKKLDLIDTSIQKNLPSKRFSTFGLGADIPYLIECNNSDDGVKILDFLHGRSKFYTLGNGSNIIFPDEELTYPLFKLGRGFNYHQIYNENEDQFSIGAATPIMSLSRALSDLSYSGLEFAAGIPATFGGACFMNAGAHNHSTSEIISSITTISRYGSTTINRSSIDYEYRKSNINKEHIITEAIIKLTKKNKEEILALRSKCLEYRKSTQPLQLPSAGSVFKNPSKLDLESANLSTDMSAAKLLELSGVKGREIGGVKFSELHSNWLVKYNNIAKAKDATDLIEFAQNQVLQHYKISLKPEIIVLSSEL